MGAIDTPTPSRIKVVKGSGDREFALEASAEPDARHRTIRFFDLGQPSQTVPGSAGKLRGTFVSSFYMSALMKLERDGTESVVIKKRTTGYAIPASEWPDVQAWLQVMSR